MKGWQTTFDSLTEKRSFFEIDFTKLYEVCVNKDFEFYLKREITYDGTYYSESKIILSKDLKKLQKHLDSELALIDNKNIKKFFTNLIKYVDIEHLYLLSLPNQFKNDKSFPIIFNSFDRYLRMIKDLHLLFSHIAGKDLEDLEETKDMIYLLIDLYNEDFSKLISKHFVDPHLRLDEEYKSKVEQISIHLKNFKTYRDHKAFLDACDPNITHNASIYGASFETGNSSNILSPPRKYTNVLGTDKTLLGELTNETGKSIEVFDPKSILKASKALASSRKAEGLKYSKIADSPDKQTLNASFSTINTLNTTNVSPIKAAEYIKTSNNFARLLGDLKLFRELSGLKLIDTTEAFPKIGENDQRQRSIPDYKPTRKVGKVDLDMLNHIDLVEEENGVQVKVKQEYQMLVNKKKTEKEEREKFEKKKTMSGNQMIDEFEDEEFLKAEEELQTSPEQRSRKLKEKLKKRIGQSEATLETLENILDRDPDAAVDINNYKFYSTLLEYKKLDAAYLEKSEKIKEIPTKAIFIEQVVNFDYKLESFATRRRTFLEKIYGRFFEEKILHSLRDFTTTSNIAQIKNNSSLKTNILNNIKAELETQKVKRIVKGFANKESCSYFIKVQLEYMRDSNPLQQAIKKRAKDLWKLARSKLKLIISLKKNDDGVQMQYTQMKNLKSIKFLQVFDQTIQTTIDTFTYHDSQNKKKEYIGLKVRRKEVKLFSQRGKRIVFPDY